MSALFFKIDVILVLNLLLCESRCAVDRFKEATLQETIFTPAQNLFTSWESMSFSILSFYTCFRCSDVYFFVKKVTCVVVFFWFSIIPSVERRETYSTISKMG